MHAGRSSNAGTHQGLQKAITPSTTCMTWVSIRPTGLKPHDGRVPISTINMAAAAGLTPRHTGHISRLARNMAMPPSPWPGLHLRHVFQVDVGAWRPRMPNLGYLGLGWGSLTGQKVPQYMHSGFRPSSVRSAANAAKQSVCTLLPHVRHHMMAPDAFSCAPQCPASEQRRYWA